MNKLSEVKQYVKEHKEELILGTLTGIAIGMTYNYVKLLSDTIDMAKGYEFIIKTQKVMLHNDKNMIDTQSKLIKVLSENK